jgi:hypothetical protein
LPEFAVCELRHEHGAYNEQDIRQAGSTKTEMCLFVCFLVCLFTNTSDISQTHRVDHVKLDLVRRAVPMHNVDRPFWGGWVSVLHEALRKLTPHNTTLARAEQVSLEVVACTPACVRAEPTNRARVSYRSGCD